MNYILFTLIIDFIRKTKSRLLISFYLLFLTIISVWPRSWMSEGTWLQCTIEGDQIGAKYGCAQCRIDERWYVFGGACMDDNGINHYYDDLFIFTLNGSKVKHQPLLISKNMSRLLIRCPFLSLNKNPSLTPISRADIQQQGNDIRSKPRASCWGVSCGMWGVPVPVRGYLQ